MQVLKLYSNLRFDLDLQYCVFLNTLRALWKIFKLQVILWITHNLLMPLCNPLSSILLGKIICWSFANQSKYKFHNCISTPWKLGSFTYIEEIHIWIVSNLYSNARITSKWPKLQGSIKPFLESHFLRKVLTLDGNSITFVMLWMTAQMQSSCRINSRYSLEEFRRFLGFCSQHLEEV